MKRLFRFVALAATAALLAGVVPANAFAVKERPLDRKEVIERAKRWTRSGVPYSQVRHTGGYRRDCSGFVSYAWGLPENLVTWRIPYVAKRIGKSDLQPGDVLLNPRNRSGGRHVVMFEKWANKKRTKYWVLESTGQNGVDRAVRRVVKYPYRIGGEAYKPYRYVGMDGYYKRVPTKHRQPVKGYRGRVEVPKPNAAERKAAAAKRQAAASENGRSKAKAAEKTRKTAEKTGASGKAAGAAKKSGATPNGKPAADSRSAEVKRGAAAKKAVKAAAKSGAKRGGAPTREPGSRGLLGRLLSRLGIER